MKKEGILSLIIILLLIAFPNTFINIITLGYNALLYIGVGIYKLLKWIM